MNKQRGVTDTFKTGSVYKNIRNKHSYHYAKEKILERSVNSKKITRLKQLEGDSYELMALSTDTPGNSFNLLNRTLISELEIRIC